MEAKKKKKGEAGHQIASSDKNDGQHEVLFPVVGIGTDQASFEDAVRLVCSIPADSGAAYVIITTISSDPEELSALIEKAAPAVTVVRLENNHYLKPNEIYTVPQHHLVSVVNGAVHLIPSKGASLSKMPVDYFIRSLAGKRKEASIAVLFGGNGTDGTLGIGAVNEVGGVSFVQDPDETTFNGMLRSAIATGCADYILPAEKIAGHLFSYIRSMPGRLTLTTSRIENKIDYLQKILQILRTHTGNDFAFYKKSTIYRRIEKRMSLHELSEYSQYYTYIQENPDEIKLLFNDLLISVTNFFRDPEAFDVLKTNILPRLLNNKPDNYQLRVWVPACATGEEVYSLAMLLHEYKDDNNLNFKIQIFGTDINEESIQKARIGAYVDNIEMDVSPDRLKKFFVKVDSTYVIRKEIRECAIFAVQNITKDAPFTKLDILSCRNLLIYFGSELQERLLPVFHYSLKPEGILFLGSSESIGKFTDAYRMLDKKWKVFQKVDTYSSNAVFNSSISYNIKDGLIQSGAAEIKKTREIELVDIVQKTLLSSFTPSGVLINERGDILFVHGHTGKYLEIAPGQANMNIFNMAKESLQYELHSAVHEAVTNKKEAVRQGLHTKYNDALCYLNLTVKPVDSGNTNNRVLLVVFEDLGAPQVAETGRKKIPRKYSGKAEELRQELQFTKENLQATIEELQASNEELQSANEELQSTNEELQSTNEEMETSKEELQSVNEELITLNAELQSKIEQLSRAEDDMRNLLNSTNIGTIFLDSKMRIKRFTSEAIKIINLISSDIGRPIEHIVTKLRYEDLIKDIQKVLDSLHFIEKEVQTKDDKWYLLRIMPYRTVENVIDGVVLTFTEISSLKTASEKLNELNTAIKIEREYADSIIHIVNQPIIVLDTGLTVLSVNKTFCREFGLKREKLVNHNIYNLSREIFDSSEFRTLLDELSSDLQFEDYPVKLNTPDDGEKVFYINTKRVQRTSTGSYITLICFDERIMKKSQ